MVLAVLKMSGDRIPFRWGNLWRIFWASLGELSFGEMFVKMSLVLGCAYCSCYRRGISMSIPAEPYALIAVIYYGVSWLFFVFFRYYFLPSHWFLWMQFAASVLYGGILGILVSLFYSASRERIISVVVCTAISTMILMMSLGKNE